MVVLQCPATVIETQLVFDYNACLLLFLSDSLYLDRCQYFGVTGGRGEGETFDAFPSKCTNIYKLNFKVCYLFSFILLSDFLMVFVVLFFFFFL
jgi:hypothetical protein